MPAAVSRRATRYARCPCGPRVVPRGARRPPRGVAGRPSSSGASARWCGAWLPPSVPTEFRVLTEVDPLGESSSSVASLSVAVVTIRLSVAGVTLGRMTQNSDGGGVSEVDWDAEAVSFDEEPDHGLRDPEVRAAWAERLRD